MWVVYGGIGATGDLGIAAFGYGLHGHIDVLHQRQLAVQSRVAEALQEVAGLGAAGIGEFLGQERWIPRLQLKLKALVLGQPTESRESNMI